MIMSDDNLADSLNQSIRILHEFKSVLKDFYETCTKYDKQEEYVNIVTLQSHLKYMLASYSTLEKNFHKLGNITFNLRNLGYLSQDPFPENNCLYPSVLKAYRWSNILVENAALASSLMAQNSLKRTTTNLSARKNRQIHNISPQMIELIVNSMDRLFGDMSVTSISTSLIQSPNRTLSSDEYLHLKKLSHIQPSNTVMLNIIVGTTLRAQLCLRSMIIEAVSVRGYDEINPVSRTNFSNDDDIANAISLLFNESASYNLSSNMWFWSNISPNIVKNQDLDNSSHEIWIESRYYVFRKITEHAQAAMLHFHSPLIPELAIKSYMTWLHSYSNLFNTACHRCQKQLKEFMPPTWRDFRTLEPYHEFCRF